MLFYRISPSIRLNRRKYAHGSRSKVRVKKNSELKGIRVMRYNYEELVSQTLGELRKSSSIKMFEFSSILVKPRQLYVIHPLNFTHPINQIPNQIPNSEFLIPCSCQIILALFYS